MRVTLVMALLCVACLSARADIPTPQLDGSWSKQSPYKDEYPYAPLDHEKARGNPLGFEVARKVTAADPDFPELGKRFEKYPFNAMDSDLRQDYVKTVEKEYELTEKERENVNKYPDRFPEVARRGKRIARAEVLTLGAKEYDFGACRIIGAEDLDGDGAKELVVRWVEPVTHAGPRSEIRVFTAKGEFVWCTRSQGISNIADAILADVDGDRRKELVLTVDRAKEFQILKCSTRPGRTPMASH